MASDATLEGLNRTLKELVRATDKQNKILEALNSNVQTAAMAIRAVAATELEKTDE